MYFLPYRDQASFLGQQSNNKTSSNKRLAERIEVSNDKPTIKETKSAALNIFQNIFFSF